jgi:hypothetical protein
MSPLRLLLPRCVIVASALIAVARAEIEFVGILVTPKMTLFALTDTTTGGTQWLPRGERIAGHVIGEFDAKTDTLLVTRDKTELRLRLKDDAKVKSARLELTGTVTLGETEKFEITRATLLLDEENVFPLKDGITYRITPSRRDDGTLQYRLAIKRAVSETSSQQISAPAVIALPGQPFSVQMDGFVFAFTPR